MFIAGCLSWRTGILVPGGSMLLGHSPKDRGIPGQFPDAGREVLNMNSVVKPEISKFSKNQYKKISGCRLDIVSVFPRSLRKWLGNILSDSKDLRIVRERKSGCVALMRRSPKPDYQLYFIIHKRWAYSSSRALESVDRPQNVIISAPLAFHPHSSPPTSARSHALLPNPWRGVNSSLKRLKLPF